MPGEYAAVACRTSGTAEMKKNSILTDRKSLMV
jgi:hypothetical protein